MSNMEAGIHGAVLQVIELVFVNRQRVPVGGSLVGIGVVG
jgi:hypothetical protein